MERLALRQRNAKPWLEELEEYLLRARIQGLVRLVCPLRRQETVFTRVRCNARFRKRPSHVWAGIIPLALGRLQFSVKTVEW